MNEIQPKIKMTKTLPDEAGLYYWANNKAASAIMGEIDDQGDFYEEGRYMRPSEMGGYWAKVDQSMFEFEGG